MAPQRSAGLSTSYGAIDLSDTPKKAGRVETGRVKLLVGLSMATLMLVSFVFTLTVTPASLQPAAPASVVDALHAGDDLPSTHDCECATAECTPLDGTVYGECPITSSDGQCEGFDYAPAYQQGGQWYAHCELVEGLYDCWRFPCIHGGFCVDGDNTYTCICPFGYEGVNCDLEINECGYKEDSADFVEGETPVCSQYATCQNTPGSYACACNPGFFGDGYAYDQESVHWGSVLEEANDYGWLSRDATLTVEAHDSNNDGLIDVFGCTDVNDCSSSPCFNGGQCVDLWDGMARGADGEDLTATYATDYARGESGSFYCDCTVTQPYTLFAGEFCQEDVDECAGALHNCDKTDRAECFNTEGSFNCMCRQFWQGDGYDPTTSAADWACEEGNDPSNPDCDEWEGYQGCEDVDDCSILVHTGMDEDGDGQEDIDVNSPCLNGATCTNDGEGTGKYACFCVVGFRGFNCEVNINECEELDDAALGCDSNADCSDTHGSWECLCNEGWTGTGDIQGGCYDADDCEYSPCQNGGTCTDCGTICTICDCVVGWRGRLCDVDWDECVMGIHTCHDMAVCINIPGSFHCECEPGYSGDGFEICNQVNDCERWEDDASVDDDTLVDYAVKKYSAEGRLIQTETPVTPAPWADDRPIMVDGAIVHQCGEWDALTRTFNPHGSCEDVGDAAFLCTCDEGWSDSNCDLDIDECARGTDICHKYGQCTNTPGSYYCTCNTGFTGDGVAACNDIDDCSVGPQSCSNGFCTDLGIGDFRCTCNEGFTDRLCDRDVDECAEMTHSCDGERSVCTNTVGSWKCGCKSGYNGDGIGDGGCIDADDCGTAPCENGQCTDNGENAYACSCDEGWTNIHCDFDVNECIMGTHDCHPDGKCVNTPGRFYCRCVSGFTGDGYTCTDLDDCDPDPCDPVHGTCEDAGQNLYNCQCTPGFMKPDCEVDEEECVTGTHQCDPNAMCFNTYGSYICQCNDEFYGDGVDCAPCTDCDEQCPENLIGNEALCHTGPGFEKDGTFPACDAVDRTCKDKEECGEQTDNCDNHADCTNTYGSFTCTCQIHFSYWGTGLEDECFECYECTDGEYMVDDCTATMDRVCAPSIPDGHYALQTEADTVKQCLVHWKEAGRVFPERYSWGGRSPTQSAQESEDGTEAFSDLIPDESSTGPAPDYCENPVCGVCPWSDRTAEENLVLGMEAVWTFRRLELDMYLILNSADGNGLRCLGFEKPTAPYPTLLTWHETTTREAEGTCVDEEGEDILGADASAPESEVLVPVACGEEGGDCTEGSCQYLQTVVGKWTQEGSGVELDELDTCEFSDQGAPTTCELGYFCGMEDNESGAARSRLMANGGTVWNVVPLGCEGVFCSEKKWSDKWLIRSLARRDKNMDGVVDAMDYDCLFFPTAGGTQYSHPRRVPDTASEDGVWLGTAPSADMDGDGDLDCGIFADGDSQEQALVDNMQAVWTLIKLPGGGLPAPNRPRESPLQAAVGLESYLNWEHQNGHGADALEEVYLPGRE